MYIKKISWLGFITTVPHVWVAASPSIVTVRVGGWAGEEGGGVLQENLIAAHQRQAGEQPTPPWCEKPTGDLITWLKAGDKTSFTSFTSKGMQALIKGCARELEKVLEDRQKSICLHICGRAHSSCQHTHTCTTIEAKTREWKKKKNELVDDKDVRKMDYNQFHNCIFQQCIFTFIFLKYTSIRS